MSTLYQFSLTTIQGETILLEHYRGKVLLIVNVASQCSFTKQYAELEALYREFNSKGFTVLGFPCNQFSEQEPGSESVILEFCETNYGISFPLFAKIDVKGQQAHPLFQFLTQKAPGFLGTRAIKWNFTKFLIDSEGNIIRRYAPFIKPTAIRKDLIKLL